jgi:hypothetical protein
MDGLSKNLSRPYGDLYVQVRNIINAVDPVKLKGRLPLEAEYDPEIAAILSAVKECRSLNEVHRTVYEIFVQKFDRPVAGQPGRYRGIAERISALLDLDVK